MNKAFCDKCKKEISKIKIDIYRNIEYDGEDDEWCLLNMEVDIYNNDSDISRKGHICKDCLKKALEMLE